MPTNETGKVIIHKGLGNIIIQPGETYPGRPVDANGDYVAEKPAEQKEAPKQGASTVTFEKIEPKYWPDRAVLKDMKMSDLKSWAKAQDLEFAGNISEEKLLDLIDQHRPKPEGENQ